MTATTLPAVPVDGSLSRYFQEIWKYPILEAKQEYDLAVRLREEGDLDAAHQLVTSHLRLVAKIAMKYRGYGLPMADLVSEGNIGLMKAVRKFEPERGFRLATYAMWWIKAAITEYVLRSWSLVKMGTLSTQKKLFFSLRRLKNKLGIEDGDLTPQSAKALSAELDVSERDIVDMNRRMLARDLSLNAPVSDEDGSMEFQDTVVDDGPSPEAMVADNQEGDLRRELLRDALAILPERERMILAERRLSENPMTLEDLGNRLGVSRERVRQLEVRAFDKIKKAMIEAMARREDAAREMALPGARGALPAPA